MRALLTLQSDNDIKISGLADADSGTYLNTATVTYAIKNEAGTTVTDGTGTLDYQTGSNGNYLGVVDAAVMVLSSAVPFTLTGTFFIEITAAQGNYDRFWRIPATVEYGS
jgi:hypothetical protein